jgi:hypothetical protein
MGVGMVIVLVFVITAICVSIIALSWTIGDYLGNKQEIEAKITLETAEMAMKNETLKIKIHDAQVSGPLKSVIRTRLIESVGDVVSDNEVRAYQKGYEEGVAAMREKAKNIVMGENW